MRKMEMNDEEINLSFGAKRELMAPQVKPHRKIGSDGKDRPISCEIRGRIHSKFNLFLTKTHKEGKMETNIAIFRGKERFIQFLRTFWFEKGLYRQHMTLAFTNQHLWWMKYFEDLHLK